MAEKEGRQPNSRFLHLIFYYLCCVGILFFLFLFSQTPNVFNMFCIYKLKFLNRGSFLVKFLAKTKFRSANLVRFTIKSRMHGDYKLFLNSLFLNGRRQWSRCRQFWAAPVDQWEQSMGPRLLGVVALWWLHQTMLEMCRVLLLFFYILWRAKTLGWLKYQKYPHKNVKMHLGITFIMTLYFRERCL